MAATFTPSSGVMAGITIENITNYDYTLTLSENHTAAMAAMLAKIN